MQTTTTKQAKNIQKAREDITRVLDRYQVTLPEIMGIARKEDADEKTWNYSKNDYEKIQERVFAKEYPALWKKIKNR